MKDTSLLFLLLISFWLTGCRGGEGSHEPDEPPSTYPINLSVANPGNEGETDITAGDRSGRFRAGVFAADGKLKKWLTDFHIPAGELEEGDMVAVLKHIPSVISGLETTTLTDLRNLEFRLSELQESDSEILYGEKRLSSAELHTGAGISVSLQRPFAMIEITDAADGSDYGIVGAVMKRCPARGTVGMMSGTGFAENAEFRKIDGSKLLLCVPPVEFGSNLAHDEGREIELHLKNGDVQSVWITRHADGKPVDVSESERQWQGLWPGHRYSFTFKGSGGGENPKVEVKDKIRVYWYSNALYGKFAGMGILLGENGSVKGKRLSNSQEYQLFEFDLGNAPHDRIPYKLLWNDLETETSVEGDLLTDVCRENIDNSNPDFTLFTLGNGSMDGYFFKPGELALRFYCRDIPEGEHAGVFKQVKFLRTDKFPEQTLDLNEDKRGYKYADFHLKGEKASDFWNLDFEIMPSRGSPFTVMDYFWDLFEGDSDYSFNGISLPSDCVVEKHDGEFYQCFYFN